MAGPRYRVLRASKRRGAAEIFEALATNEAGVERRVSLKRIHPDHLGDESIVSAFEIEAKVIGGLGDQRLVEVLDYGLLDGVPFTISEWVDGLDLEALRQHAGGVVPLEVAGYLVGEVALGLSRAHQSKDADGHPLLHRDLRPENVIVSWEGEVKLCDFGTAWAHRRLDRTTVGPGREQHQLIAPEQERGDPIDTRADIYSLGCLLHLLVTGRSPVQRADPEASITMNPVLPSAVMLVVAKATRTRPEARYASADLFRADLAEALGSSLSGKFELIRWLNSLRGPTPPEAVAPTLFEFAETDEPSAPGERTRRYASTAGPDAQKRITAARAISSPVGIRPTDGEKTELGRAPLWSGITEPPKSQAAPGLVSAADPLIGAIVQGYRIEGLIGAGTTARVYRVRQPSAATEYAMKVLAPRLAQVSAVQRRFEREATALKSLEHPNVVDIVDYGATPDGRPFFVMSLLRGKSLKRLIGRPLSFERVAQIALDVARGLAAAHGAGLLHRDLKPSNIMLVSQGHGERAKIVDFGCTRSTVSDWQTRLTRPGSFIGTAAYASPEQLLDAAGADERADLYGLGAVIYAMIAGKPPFKGDVVEVFRAKQTTLPKPPPDARGLGAIAMQLLAIKREDRPKTATEVIGAIEDLAFGIPEDLSHDQLDAELDARIWLGDDEPIDTPKAIDPSRSSSEPSSRSGGMTSPTTGTVPMVVVARRGLPWALYVLAFVGAFVAVLAGNRLVGRLAAAAHPAPIPSPPPVEQPQPIVQPKPRVESLPVIEEPTESADLPRPRLQGKRPNKLPEDAPDWSGLLQSRLEALGLEVADVVGSSSHRAFEAARRSGDVTSTGAALEVLIRSASDQELAPERLGERLDRLQHRLEEIAGAPTSPQLEQRFLELRSRLSRLEPSGRIEFSKKIRTLAQDADRAAPSRSP